MPTSAYVIGCLVVLLTALFAVAYHYLPLFWAYQATDAYRRAAAIRREDAHLRAELRVAESALPPVPADAIRTEAFGDCLRSVSIQALKTHPGIGDMTVQRLAEAGYRTLLDAAGRLTRPTFQVRGIGPSRAKDVADAVRSELRTLRQAFDGGTVPFARRAEAEVARLTAERDATVARNEGTAARLRLALRDLKPYLEAARVVSFRAFLGHRRSAPDQPWAYDLIHDSTPPRIERPEVAIPLPAASVSPHDLLPPLATRPVRVPDAVPVSQPEPVPPRAPPVAGPPKPPARLPPSIEAIATILFGVARADGRLAAAERVAVRQGLARFFEHHRVLARYIDPAVERLAAATLDLPAALVFAGTLSRPDRDLLSRCAADVADATGTRHPARAEVIERLARAVAALGDTPPPAAHSSPIQPTDLRSNGLLDDLLSAPEPAPVVARQTGEPATAPAGLRENSLLDDVFGG